MVSIPETTVLISAMFKGSNSNPHPEVSISEMKKASNQITIPFNSSALKPNVITERASANLDKRGQSSALNNPSHAVTISATTRLRA
jgi:hypothetical protein